MINVIEIVNMLMIMFMIIEILWVFLVFGGGDKSCGGGLEGGFGVCVVLILLGGGFGVLFFFGGVWVFGVGGGFVEFLNVWLGDGGEVFIVGFLFGRGGVFIKLWWF